MILYRLSAAARALSLSPVTLRSAIRRGRLQAERRGGRWYVTQHAVTMYDLQSRGQYGRASAHYRRAAK